MYNGGSFKLYDLPATTKSNKILAPVACLFFILAGKLITLRYRGFFIMAISQRKKEHSAFIASSEWAKIRVDLFMLRGEKCEQCGRKKNLHIHHLTYERFGGDEEPEDLIILCAKCHMLEHGLIKKKKKRKKKKRESRKRKVSNIDFVESVSVKPSVPRFAKGLPRECLKCNTWARYKKPKKHNGCFTVTCPACHNEFEIVVGMKKARKNK
jgi:hypothetical protein